MSLSTRRPVRLSLACFAVALTFALLPAGAAAATFRVGMDFSDFINGNRTIARGDAIRWKNTSDFVHDVKSDLKGYFASRGGTGGMSPGETYTRTFRSSGTFGYICREHEGWNMSGTIVVPISVTKLTSPVRFRIVVASQNASAPFRHVIQVKKPGAAGWTMLATTASNSFTFTPANHGNFQFRSMVKNMSANKSSGPSPVVSRSW